MVEEPDAEKLSSFLKSLSETEVLATWIKIAAWMIVSDDKGYGTD